MSACVPPDVRVGCTLKMWGRVLKPETRRATCATRVAVRQSLLGLRFPSVQQMKFDHTVSTPSSSFIFM